MGFLLRIPKNAAGEISIYNTFPEENLEILNRQNVISLYISANPGGKYKSYVSGTFIYYIIGDFILPSGGQKEINEYISKFFNDFSPEKLRESRGNFYIIEHDREKQCIKVFNSIMSILPVYYYVHDDAIWVSSRKDLIVKYSNQSFIINKKYILEHILFGYAFQNETLFINVNLLATNHYLSINNGKSTQISHTDITDYYSGNAYPWRKSLEHLSDLFINRIAGYLPDQPYYSSLTGGLDGRTLLAVGLYKQKNITTYSYGSQLDRDVTVPSYISAQIGVNYEPFILDKKYAAEHFMNNAKQAGRLTEGSLRFSRAAYMYIAETLASSTDHLVSGNFGSELMRTMRMPGNLISQVVFDIFESNSEKQFIQKIRNSPRIKYLDISFFKNEFENIIFDCITYKNSFPDDLSLNQKFYKYLLEEVFRKYFGPEIVLMNQYFVNRTPFLDFPFMTELFKSELAGCNGSYKVSNPIDRFKGQALYPHIIKKSYPGLLKYKLDRGYSPGEFLSRLGYLNIAFGYYLRKVRVRGNKYTQPTYNELAFTQNEDKLKQIKYYYPFVNIKSFKEVLRNSTWKSDHINFNIHISLFDYLEHVLNNYKNVTLE